MANDKEKNNNENSENAGKKKHKYIIETMEPLEEGRTYQMTFVDKRGITAEE